MTVFESDKNWHTRDRTGPFLGNTLFHFNNASLRQLDITYQVNRFEASEGIFLTKTEFAKHPTQRSSTEGIFPWLKLLLPTEGFGN